MNQTFKYLITGLLVFLSVSLYSQNASLLERLYEGFASHCVVIDCEFTMNTDGALAKGKCKVEVQGDSFIMTGSGIDIFCDGKSVWTLDNDAKEAYIEPFGDGVFNPARIFSDMQKLSSVVSSSAVGNGMKYELTARQTCGISRAVLTIGADALLKSADFTLDDGNVISINVLSMENDPLKNKGHFSPSNLSSDWIITDLR